MVLVTKGKDRGKQGQVRKVVPGGKKTDKWGRPDDWKIIVTGVNMLKKHQRQRAQNKPGGIIERESPISWANVALICTGCNKPVRVGFRMSNDRKVRFCKSCDANID
jgi:large subunit ribosomal protein L24